MCPNRIISIAAVISLFLLPSALFAGSSSSQAGSEIHFKPEEIIKFAKKVEKTLAMKGAKVAIIARAGRHRNELPEGINYTHTAIAVYSIITTSDNREVPGYAIYNLYQRADAPNVSDLIQDYPVDFFAAAKVLEAGIIIPSSELQKRLLNVIRSDTYKKLHVPNYSVIANPFTREFQNCTEHTLDVIVSAIYQTADIELIKKNEKAYFEPQVVNVNPLKLIVGSIFSKDITTSDHPDSTVKTTSFTKIAEFLAKYNAASEIFTIYPDTADMGKDHESQGNQLAGLNDEK